MENFKVYNDYNKKKGEGYPSIDKVHLKDVNFFGKHPIIPSFLTFSQVLDIMFKLQGNHNIVDCLDLRIDSNKFMKDSLDMAKALLELGVKPNDIITVSMPNYYQAIPVFKAANMIGAAVTYLNPLASVEETRNYLKMYESPILINSGVDELYNSEVKKGTNVKHIITMNENLRNDSNFYQNNGYEIGNSDNLSFHELGLVGNFYKNKYKTNFGGKQDALILYTSGSTGKAKSLLFTNENLIASCIYLKNSTHVPNVTENDMRWMNVVPFMYPYGFGASVLQTFLSGREVILTPNLSLKNISYYYSKKPHLVFGSPAHLELTKRNLPEDQDLSGLKIYLSGGDYLSVSQSRDAIEYFKKHGADTTISNSSGTGETLGCSTNAMNIDYRPETVGQLVVGPEYIVIDPDTGKEVKYGEVGVLCTTGKHVFKGYYGNKEATDAAMMIYNGKKYYVTGNIGFLEKDRYFTLIGRASRFFIINTLNKVYCELVQQAVSSIDIVDSCAVVPKPNDETLYKCKSYVVLKPGVIPDENTENYIIEKCKEPFVDPETLSETRLKDYEIPESVTFLDILPRTPLAEKVDYEKLKDMALQEFNAEKEKVYVRK